jgi:hypothetical protein
MLAILLFNTATKTMATNSCTFLKIYYYTSFQDPELSGISVTLNKFVSPLLSYYNKLARWGTL